MGEIISDGMELCESTSGFTQWSAAGELLLNYLYRVTPKVFDKIYALQVYVKQSEWA